MEIVLATRNMDKIREIKRIFKGIKMLTLNELKKFPKVREDGKTLKENAVKKAIAISKFSKKIAIADDTGLEVNSLNGSPGVFSSRFAGFRCSYEDNNKKLLRLLNKVPDTRRQAIFKCVIAIANPDGKFKFVQGVCRGKISRELKGKNGFGYDPVFIPDGFKKTFAEIKPVTKNKISHRGKALRKAKKLLSHFSGRSASG